MSAMAEEWGRTETDLDEKAWGDTEAELETDEWGVEHEDEVARKMRESLGEHLEETPVEKEIETSLGVQEVDERSVECDRKWGAKE